MPLHIILAVLVVSAVIGLAVFVGASGPRGNRKRVNENLLRGIDSAHDLKAASMDSPVVASADERSSLAWRLTPATTVTRLERLHTRAGHPADWPVERLVVGKLFLAAVAGSLAVIYILSSMSGLSVVLGLGVTVVAYFLPELLLSSRAQERAQAIELELADTLDQMTIAVEAGLAFDSAMAQAAKNGRGPLAQELARTLQDLQVGQSRRQAYEGLAERTQVPDLRRFTRAVIQATAYGVSIADVLKTQASEMRLKRRQRAEEKAMQIPVKVIFPLIVCILPVLFIVLLGPAALDIVAAFSGG